MNKLVLYIVKLAQKKALSGLITKYISHNDEFLLKLMQYPALRPFNAK